MIKDKQTIVSAAFHNHQRPFVIDMWELQSDGVLASKVQRKKQLELFSHWNEDIDCSN